MNILKVVVATVVGIMLMNPSLASGESDVLLENARIAVVLDRSSGAIRSIQDKELGETYPQEGVGWEITTDRGTIRPGSSSKLRRSRETVAFLFDTKDFAICLRYRLGPEDAFVEKWLEVRARDGKPYFLKEMILEDAKLGPEFREIHFHDDQTIWHCPINLFLRGEKGGCFAGLEYPYWDYQIHGKEGFRLGYKPNYQAVAGEVNTSEKYFLGVYRREGISRYSHGPYPGKRPTSLVQFEKDTGLFQHFKNRKIPAEVVEPEVLDWGEVWAMQEFMRRVLPDLPLPEDGYWIWQNGWWAGLTEPSNAQLDRLKAAGVHDVMTQQTWYGRGDHPSPEPYLWDMRMAPIGFPVDQTGQGTRAASVGPAAGLHVKSDAPEGPFQAGQYTKDFRAPKFIENAWTYGKRIGVHLSSFAVPGMYFNQRPEWGAIDKNGKLCEYLFDRKVNCPACNDYMDFLLKLHCKVFDKYQPRWWGWDGRWLNYWEVPAYRKGPEGLGPDPCYASNHNHLPGDSSYVEWKNIQSFLGEIRRRYPRMCLEEYLGLKRGGPWALRHLNADDNYYESNGADMNRLQTWHNQNDRFRPVYKNYAAIFGRRAADFQFNVIATISVTSYCQIGPGFEGLALPENLEFLKKWRSWASENLAYLKVKRDLFECPGYSPVDGSAHIIRDRGFIFLFPGGRDMKTQLVRIPRAAIPLNRWLGLREDTNAVFQITEVYPRENTELGVYTYGQELLFDMPRDSAVILSLAPAPVGKQPHRPAPVFPDDQVVVVKAFTSGDEKDMCHADQVQR